jgi:hypothetical protein
VASNPVVQIFHTLEEPNQDFTKYEIVEVVSVEVDLDHWLKRTCGTRSESPGTYPFGEFTLIGYGKPQILESRSNEDNGSRNPRVLISTMRWG